MSPRAPTEDERSPTGVVSAMVAGAMLVPDHPCPDPAVTHGESADDTLPGEWRPPDFVAVQECLTLCARAVRQFHTYPESSPLCRDAIAACHQALVVLAGRDHLAFRVAPHHLFVDDVPVGAGTIIEHELARRLHRAHVAVVEIGRMATPRDLTRFCSDLSRFGESIRSSGSFLELLTEHGVGHITARPAHRPEVFDVGIVQPPVQQLVEHEKQRRQALFAAGGPVQHLYPPDKGWIRVDPSASPDSLSLVDLALLIDNPADVAVALMRLTGDEVEATQDPRVAFEAKFSDLALIFSAVDPRLARLLFSKLSRAMLELDADRRARLLKRTVLPGLLDGKLDGSVLTDFPDVDLAEALCLLLDLETASPDVLTTALDRLGLPPVRRQQIVPILEARLRGPAEKTRTDSYGHDHAIETYARKLIAMKPGEARSFAEYTAFDLSVTEQTRSAVAGLVSAIQTTNLLAAELETRCRLVRLEPNPALVSTFMDRTLLLFERLERQHRWGVLAQWAGRFGELADALRESRPDAADAILAGLQRFCTVRRALVLAELCKGDAKARAAAHAFIVGFGAAPVEAFLAALDAPGTAATARPLIGLMAEHAETFAPMMATRLLTCGTPARQAIVRVLGSAGADYAPVLIEFLDVCDETSGREAFRALARIGTAPAAAAVAAHLSGRVAWASLAAEEALWQFPPTQAAAQVRKLLASRDFVLGHPDVAGRLLERAAQAGTTGLAPALETIAPLRFRFWKPALVRVAIKARQMLHS
ncbi:MAG: hypothetical protein AB7F99_14465 [Vicinamibacterales bacterium]